MTIDAYSRLHDRLASIREKMKSAAIAWRASAPQASVHHGIEFSRYSERSVLEVFVEVSIPSGQSICWWIDLEPKDGGFLFEATLRKNNGVQEMQDWERCEKDQSVDLALHLVETLMQEIERDAFILGSSIFASPEELPPTPDSPPQAPRG